MRGFVLMICCLGCVAGLRGQDTAVPKKDLVDVFVRWLNIKISDSTRKKNRFIFSIIPIAPVNLGQKQAAVSAINLSFYAGNPANTNISSVYFIPYTNFTDRGGFLVTPNVWLGHNRWNLNGDWRVARSTGYTYGAGGGTPSFNKDVLDYRYVRMYVNANHQLWGAFNAGFGYDLDYYYQVVDEKTSGYPTGFSAYGLGTGSTTQASGLSFNLLFDRRRNSINPDHGFYGGVTYRVNPSFLPNDYSWTSLYVDLRKYIPLSSVRRSILAIWGLYWGTYGDVPYLLLPGTTLDAGGRTGRGYPVGRYRGKQMLYGEGEWRVDLSRDGFWGGVVFANVESYAESSGGYFAYLLPAAGVGLRLKFNKRNDMNLTMDIGVGKNSFNWYLNLGEFF